MGYAGVVEQEMERLIPLLRDILREVHPLPGDA